MQKIKNFLGYVIKKAIGKGKVSPTIKSVKPNTTKSFQVKDFQNKVKSVEAGNKEGAKGSTLSKEGNAKIRKKVKETMLPSARKKLLKIGRERMMGGGMMGRPMYKKGGKSFPDLTGDGKVTKKDILKGRGVPGFKDGSKGPVRKKIPNKAFGTGEGRPFPGGEKKRKEKLEKLKNK